MNYGIIAAGQGSRLVQEGVGLPKLSSGCVADR